MGEGFKSWHIDFAKQVRTEFLGLNARPFQCEEIANASRDGNALLKLFQRGICNLDNEFDISRTAACVAVGLKR